MERMNSSQNNIHRSHPSHGNSFLGVAAFQRVGLVEIVLAI
ncbi:MAG: hypothetical protein WC455_20420 [Dehalococcoidia bacterium]|jgi:hypothetical protein